MRRTLGAAAGLFALVLAGCGTTAPLIPSDPTTPRDGGEVAVYGCAPAGRMVPGDAVDACGVRIMDAVNDRLIRYRGERGDPEPNLATEIGSSDGRTFTVHLARGRTFHDGTEIKAHNFIKAWNWNATGANKYAGAGYFAMIEGAAAMACRDTASGASAGPGATTSCARGGQPTELSGLHEIDDYTFTITLTKPMPRFADVLGHPVYSPYPDSFFAPAETPAPWQRIPAAGSGPFRIESVQPGEILLRRADKYPAERRPHVDRVVVRTYAGRASGLDDAYADLVGGRLDFSDVIPSDNFYDDQWKGDLKERWRQSATPRLETLTFATDDRQLRDPEIRRAISRVIDRQALTRQVFNDTRTPATGWVPEGVGDYRAGACGDLCETDVKAARQEFEDAGGYTGQFFITVNADGGHKQWADALCNQLKVNLGLDCQARVVANHAEITRLLAQGQLAGLYRQDWTVPYATPEAYLAAYLNGAYAGGGYRNAAFEEKMAAARAAGSAPVAAAEYRTAEDALVANPPAIPLWTAANPVGWSARTHGISLTPQGWLDLGTVWAG